MLLFRSITAGLLGACVFLLAQLGGPDVVEPVVVHEPVVVTQLGHPSLGVIDIAHGVPAAEVLSLIRLGPDERISAVDDREVANQLVAGTEIADAIRDGARFVDLSIDKRRAPKRRLVVLLH